MIFLAFSISFFLSSTSISFDNTWTSYRYYLYSNVADYMYYKDIDIDDNGTYDYRGVYFTNYMTITGGGVRIVVRGRIVGILHPAHWQRVCSGGGEGLKVLEERHRHWQAGSQRTDGGRVGGAVARMPHTEVVGRGGHKVGEGVAGA